MQLNNIFVSPEFAALPTECQESAVDLNEHLDRYNSVPIVDPRRRTELLGNGSVSMTPHTLYGVSLAGNKATLFGVSTRSDVARMDWADYSVELLDKLQISAPARVESDALFSAISRAGRKMVGAIVVCESVQKNADLPIFMFPDTFKRNTDKVTLDDRQKNMAWHRQTQAFKSTELAASVMVHFIQNTVGDSSQPTE